MSSKTTASRRRKINITRRIIAILNDCLYQEKKSWDKIDARKYRRMVTELENSLKSVSPSFQVTIDGGVVCGSSSPQGKEFTKPRKVGIKNW